MALFVIGGCHLETAKSSRNQKLFIASDYLHAKDVTLFNSFSKETGIKVFVLHAPKDSILQQLKNEKFATDIDIVLLESVFDAIDFSKEKVLQPILKVEDQPSISFRLRAHDYQWVGIGIDPFIFVQAKDSLAPKSSYLECLKRENWTTNLKENTQLLPLMTGLVHRVRGESDSIKDGLLSHIFRREVNFSRPSDSLKRFTTLLTTYSSFYSDTLLYNSGYKNGKILFPNQSKGGLQFNLRTAAIIKQAKNYTNALEFIKYFTEEKANERINNWWNTFPVNSNMNKIFSYQKRYFKRYPIEFSVLHSYKESTARDILKSRKK
ncbi:MAG: hypothetical protein V4638_11775 [Bacteroidota bacterium]